MMDELRAKMIDAFITGVGLPEEIIEENIKREPTMTMDFAKKENKAFITGITGQDGSYLAELLIEKGYEVHGLIRRTSAPNTTRIDHIMKDVTLHEGDITDYARMHDLIYKIGPSEIYNLAAQSHVGSSYDQTDYTWDVTAKGAMYILDIIKDSGMKFYQASSSEMFGDSFDIKGSVPEGYEFYMVGKDGKDIYRNKNGNLVESQLDGIKYQDENTRFNPRSPYAVAKLAAHNMVDIHRKAYSTFAVSGILFNHDSERRGENFVTRKITKWIGSYISSENQSKHPKLYLGDLSTYRDFGHSKDYVYGQWLMLQQDIPKDYVLATNQTHRISEFLQDAFSIAGLNADKHVIIESIHKRPLEVPYLNGDYSLAKRELGWEPSITYKEIVGNMVNNDIKLG
jgi:GDPmannose 4,6-dehydratase